ncbi:MAG: MFS transporter [Terriglobales bacterium]
MPASADRSTGDRPAADSPLSARAAFAYPDFTAFSIARFCIVAALEMQSVAVGWQVYEITKRPLDLGLIGLAQFLPGITLFLPAGHVVDRLNRRRLLIWCYASFAMCSGILFLLAERKFSSVYPIYGVIVLIGTIRSFNFPAARALLPQLVPEIHFSNAVAWSSSIFQTATILGPTFGGLLYAFFRGPELVYATAMVTGFVAALAMTRVKAREKPRPREPMSLQTVLAGLHYIWREKLILGSISLDLFAVLLGGAVALLPVYARTILHTGPWGLGLLRSAPGVGAAAMAVLLAHRPLQRQAGPIMLVCVAGFGVFTIVFGLSHSLILSLFSLLLVGACDMVSVVIRAILVQIGTPDAMRGRVNAVDMIFIGASNQLGEFEYGLTAHWFGTVPAVVLGGVGTLVVIGLWTWMFPELRKTGNVAIGKLDENSKAPAGPS